MKALFGIVSLLAAVVVAGLLVSKQLKATGPGQNSHGAASSPSATLASQPGTSAEQSRQLQDKVRTDVQKALEQGASRGGAEQ